MAIVRLLRAPGGCPWDREQTHESVRRNLLEEAYEAAEAIDEDDAAHLQEELGDVLLQVVFHAEMEREKQSFDLNDVADGVCKKLVYRHPHVFGSAEASTSEEVLRNWDALKRVEKHQKTTADAMKSVARSLPQLIRAEKVQKKAAKTGFDWPDAQGALDKVREETEEVRRAAGGDGDPAEEIGDLLFAAVNTARLLGIDPERALERASDKFISRFAKVEASGQPLRERTPAQLDALWEQAKRGDAPAT